MLFDAIQGGFSSFDFRSFIMRILLSVPPFLLALSAHEAAHGWVANRCGDPTAKLMGRVTLNPIPHIDPVGFLMLFIVGFGWAKPVPVNPNNFCNYRRDDLKVSLAGVTANFLLYLIGFVAMYLIAIRVGRGAWGFSGVWVYLYQMLVIFTQINLVLALFNLIPVPPLDGYHVLNDLILRRPLFAPRKAAMIGQVVLMALVFTGLLGRLLGAVVEGVMGGTGVVVEALFRALNIL